jgi:hypothetical protein
MNTQIMPIAQITQQATQVLVRELGAVNTIRFLNQFRAGQGDYTLEREQLFAEASLDEILSNLKQNHDS